MLAGTVIVRSRLILGGIYNTAADKFSRHAAREKGAQAEKSEGVLASKQADGQRSAAVPKSNGRRQESGRVRVRAIDWNVKSEFGTYKNDKRTEKIARNRHIKRGLIGIYSSH